MLRIRSDEAFLQKEITFCNNLTYLMRVKKVPYKKLADALGVSTSMISQYRLGRSFPCYDKVKIIAEVLECKIEDLFNEDLIPWESEE